MAYQLRQHLEQLKASGQKGLAVLLDPDKIRLEDLPELIANLQHHRVDILLLGGSLVANQDIHLLVPAIKALTDIPLVLFPGSLYQIVPEADAMLFLSLISGRNADFLIGRQVEAAPLIRSQGIQVLPTGYMLVDCGNRTTAHYMSASEPIPYDKNGIAVATAMAGELLGLQALYLDGGSGAARTVSPAMLRAVRQAVDLPLIAGGGIREASAAIALWQAGADLLVIGTAWENGTSPGLLPELAAYRSTLTKI